MMKILILLLESKVAVVASNLERKSAQKKRVEMLRLAIQQSMLGQKRHSLQRNSKRISNKYKNRYNLQKIEMLLLVISTLTSHLNQPANRSRNNSQHFKNVDSSQQPPHRSSAPQARPPAHHVQHLHPAGVQEHR